MRADDLVPERVIIGIITSAVGLRGAVRVKPLTDFPERFSQTGPFFIERDGRVIEVHLEQARCRGKTFVIELAGYHDRTAAERLRGWFLSLPGETLEQLPEGEFYTFEIIGMLVSTTDGEDIGTVVDVYSVTAEDLLEIERPDGSGRFLVPFVACFVKEIDIQGRKLVLDLIDGIG